MATEVASLFARLGLESRQFQSGLNEANTSLTGFSKKLGYTMISLAKFGLAAGAAATAFIATKAISEFANFEKALANVSTLVDTSIVSMEKLKNEIMELPPVLGSATELAEGLYQAISAGIEPARAVEFIAEAAKAAKAGLTDTFTAVDAGTTILNAFGMQASEATNVFDQMFTAVKEGKTTFEALSSTIGRLSPIAAAASVSSEEMFAALATLTKGGFATSEAVSRMATALGAIVKPTKEASDMAEELGLQFDAQALQAKGLHRFLRDVKRATGGNIQSMAQLFGGMESLSVMLALVGKQSEEFTRILGSMEDAAGATEEAFDKQRITLSAVWETFKNTIGKQAILIGEELAPMLKEIIEKTSEWLEANRDLITAGFKGVIITLTTLVGWIKDFVLWIDKSVQTLGRWTQKFIDFQNAIGEKVKDFIVNFLGVGSTVKPLGEKIDEMLDKILGFSEEIEYRKPKIIVGFDDEKFIQAYNEHIEFMRIAGLTGIELIQEFGRMEIEATQLKYDELIKLNDKNLKKINRLREMRTKEIAKREELIQKQANLIRYQQLSEVFAMTTENFRAISEAGGKFSRESFAMYKAFAIADTIIKTYEAAQLAYAALAGIPIIGPALAAAAAAVAIASGLARVSMIKAQKMPTYDEGGISTKPGLYYAKVPEAHIPLERGSVPVEFKDHRRNRIEKMEPIQINITLELDGQILSDFIYNRTKDGDQIIHTRGITNI